MLDTTPQTHILFLDLQEIAGMENAELVVNQAEKCPANPVLPLGDYLAWDRQRASSWAGSIIFDEDERLFKLWYFGGPAEEPHFTGIGYAWSDDGISWQKPSLGLYEYRGSRDNNICFQSPTGLQLFMIGTVSKGLADHFTVVKDLLEPDPGRRYKGWTLVYWPEDGYSRKIAVYSPDGIHWTVGERPVPYPIRDESCILIDDADPDPARRIKVYGNPNENVALGHVDMGYGPDIERMRPNPRNPVFAPGLEHTIHLFSVLEYRGYYLALYDYNLWQDYDGMHGDPAVRDIDPRVPAPKTGAFVGDVRLAVSRDGCGPFTRVNAHQPLVARGARGAWDGGFLVMPGPVVRDGEILIFYTGVDEAGGALPNHRPPEQPIPLRTGLARLRPDGFTHLQARDGYGPACITTHPLRMEGAAPRLILNAARLLPYRDWVEVEILDEATGQPVEGYSRADCLKIASEGIRLPVRWQHQATLSGIRSPRIALRFYLYGLARLHSFTFTD